MCLRGCSKPFASIVDNITSTSVRNTIGKSAVKRQVNYVSPLLVFFDPGRFRVTRFDGNKSRQLYVCVCLLRPARRSRHVGLKLNVQYTIETVTCLRGDTSLEKIKFTVKTNNRYVRAL